MELRHLRYFMTVASEGGFGRAAAALNLAQPALSRQIKDLEEEIGLELLERTPRGVSTTSAGDAFLIGGALVIAAAEKAIETARRVAAGREGTVVLGVGRVMIESGHFATAIAALRQHLPDVDIQVEEVYSYDLPPLIAGGQVDVGFCNTEDNIASLANEPYILANLNHAMVSLDHRLAMREEITPADLADEPVAFISDHRGPRIVARLREVLKRSGITSPQEFVYVSPQSAIMIVASGRGWAPCPQGMANRVAGIAIVPVRGLDFPVEVRYVWRPDETRSVVLAVTEVLRSLWERRPPVLKDLRTTVRAPRGLPPGLELRHLRYFVAVADEGGFGRAAERLAATQPSLSRQVADLEHFIGAPLFQRTTRGADLTDAGKALRKCVNPVFDELDDMLGAARQVKRGIRRRCVIGGVHTATGSRILGAAMRLCSERHPGLELVFEDYPSPRQPDALRDGMIDIGICNAYVSVPDDPEIAHERLLDDSIDYALFAEHHPLAARDSVTAPELAGMPFLFMSRSFHPPFHDRVMAKLEALGLKPKVEAGYDSLPVIWVMAAEGHGWALGFASHLATPPTGLVAVRIEGLHLAWGLDLLWRRREVNPVVGKVLTAVRDARRATAARAPRISRPRPRITPAAGVTA